MKLFLLFLLFPCLATAGPKEDVLIIVNDLQNIVSSQSKKKVSVQSPQPISLQISPELIISKLAVYALNLSSLQGVYKQFGRENNKGWYLYGVSGIKEIQLKFVYRF